MKKMGRVMAAVAGLLLASLGASSCTSSKGMPEPITIGLTPYEYSALMYVAQDQGFFAKNGLNVTIRDYGTTQQAMDGLLAAEVDTAFTTEYAVAGEAFNKDNILILGNIDKYQLVYLIGRKDKGIEKPANLAGKKIGLTRKTIGEFYLSRFLTLQGLSMQDVTLVDLLPADYVQALLDGRIEALVAVTSIADQVQTQLGEKAVIWPAQSNQNGYYVLVSRGDWTASHAGQINRLLKALDQGEGYIINHPDESKAIIQKRLNLNPEYMVKIWPQNQFGLSLDQSLVLAMEDEARWMIENNLTSDTHIPNFLDTIHEDALKSIKPQAVNIIR